jgi:WD40 repeat protein
VSMCWVDSHPIKLVSVVLMQSTLKSSIFQPFKPILLVLFTIWLAGCGLAETESQGQLDQSIGGALAADINTDAQISVVSSIDNGISVWSLDQHRQIFNFRHAGEGDNLVTHLDISYDGLYLLSADKEAFGLWDLTVGEPVGFWRIDEARIRDIAVSKKGLAILIGKSNGKVMYLEPQTGRRLEFLGHSEKINSVDLSPNGNYALTGGNDYVAYLWDTRTGQIVYMFRHTSRVSTVILDEYGRYALTADSKDQSIIWDLTTGRKIAELDYFERQKILTAGKFSQDGQYLLTGSPSRSLDLWDVASGQRIKQYKVGIRPDATMPTAMVYGVDYLNEQQIMSLSSSGYAEVWNVPKPKP